VKNRVREWNVHDLPIGKDLLHLVLEAAPFKRSPEVVDHPKTAARQIFAKGCRIAVIENHLSGLARIDHRIPEEVGMVHRYDSAFPRYIDSGYALKYANEVFVTGGIVGVPVLDVTRDAAVVHEAGKSEVIVLHRLRRQSTKVAVVAVELEMLLCKDKCGAQEQQWTDGASAPLHNYALPRVHALCQN
jgi:hypothetical protein